MSKSNDIRSFFTVVSKKIGTDGINKSPDKKPTKKPTKKAKVIISSDDEDVVKETPERKKNKSSEKKPTKKAPVVVSSDEEDVVEETPEPKKNKSTKRMKRVLSSDSENESKSKAKSPTKKSKTKEKEKVTSPKLKAVNIDDFFGTTPIKQSKVEPLPPKVEIPEIKKSVKKKKRKNTELGVHNDVDFEKTLLDLDDDLFLDNIDVLEKTMEEALKATDEKKEGSSKENSPKDQEKRSKKLSASETVDTPNKKKRARKLSASETVDTPNKKKKLEHSDSGIDPDQEIFEKKRYSAMLYQKYKNRGGPRHHGTKELPKGKPRCLKNLTFLRTGVLDSLESDEFENLVKEHGGRVVHAISKKVDYIVVGEDAGPAKLEKAKTMRIPSISEDELLDMILVKSDMEPKFAVKTISETISEDLGIATEEEPSPKKAKKKVDVLKTETEAVESQKASSPNRKESEKKLKEKEVKEEVIVIKTEKEAVKTQNVPTTKSKESNERKPNLKSLEKDVKEKGNKIKKQPESTSLLCKDKPTNKIVKTEDLKQIERLPITMSSSSMMLTEKYKPNTLEGIIGQQDDNSNLKKLKKWLQNWNRNQKPEIRAKLMRPSPWSNDHDGAYFKCVLLSGPPGVGKTTTATLVCKELGYDVVEFNASDTRSKKLLQVEVSQLLSTQTIAGFASGNQKTDRKRVLLMDEVDGMAGNEDRGGIQELIALIKNSKIPIICMCNDRNHQKMRSLVNHCLDLGFSKPKMETIRRAMLTICFKEGIKIKPDALVEIISGTDCDIRQTLNHLSMWTAGDRNLSVEMAEKEAKVAKKDTVLGPWEVLRKVFTEANHKTMSLMDKSKLFFYDYSLGPLFVQENYLIVKPSNCKKKDEIKRAALAADAISMGDLIDSKIRSTNNWSLLESQAMYSSVLPGFYMSGNIKGRVSFPSWLGKNSTRNKLKRMLSELQVHTRMSTSGSKLAMKLDYLVPLRDAIIKPLKREGLAGVSKAVGVMKEYNLLREDLDNLVELCRLSSNKNAFSEVESRVKAAFTKAYNKEAPLLPFAPPSAVSKKKAAAQFNDLGLEEEDEGMDSDHEDNDDIKVDAMIKVKGKAKAAAGKGKKVSGEKAGTSKTPNSKGKGGRAKKTK